MRDGVWWVLFGSDEPLTLEDLATALREIEGATATVGEHEVMVSLEGKEFAVELDDSPQVLEEARAAADKFGAKHPEHFAIRRCYRRFIIRFVIAWARDAARALTAIENALSNLVEKEGRVTYLFNPKVEHFF